MTTELSPPSRLDKSYGSIPKVHVETDRDGQDDDDSFSSDTKRCSWSISALAAGLLLMFVAFGHQQLNHDQAESFYFPLLGSPRSQNEHRRRRRHQERFGRNLVSNHLDAKPLYYDDQKVDHMDKKSEKTFPYRFFKISKHWKGPGHPIFVVLGGEDPVDEIFYPFVYKGLAKTFGAFVLEPEHRFYGESMPVRHPSVADLMDLLSVDQALLDFVQLIQDTRVALGCSLQVGHRDYCPVITAGGSYPGVLSFLLRFVYPDVVDIGYAASAPIILQAQDVDPNAYFDAITDISDHMSPGCANAVRSTLFAVRDELMSQNETLYVKDAARALGYCRNIPRYIKDIETLVSEAIIYMVPAIFADFNMFSYPPGPKTATVQACSIFQDDNLLPMQKMTKFLRLRGEVEYREKNPKCFDLNLELPTGRHATIMGSDWTGSGGDYTAEIWEFQCCRDAVSRTGYSNTSMFIPRAWTWEWHKAHCEDRFPGITVEPYRLVNQWGFTNLQHASRILFTNGMNDGWAHAGSVLEDVNDSVLAINFPNGAHHSEFSDDYPDDKDTDDIKAGYQKITQILSNWLDEIKHEDTKKKPREKKDEVAV